MTGLGRCLVLGATGSVGGLVARRLTRGGGNVLVASRSEQAARSVSASIAGTQAVTVDVTEQGWEIPRDVTVVVDCTGTDQEATALRATDSGCAYISVSASLPHTNRLFGLHSRVRKSPGSVVVGAGLAPGISTMLAHRLLLDDPESAVRIDVVLDAFDSFGSAAATFTTELVGTTFPHPCSGHLILNFSDPTTLNSPGGFGRVTTSRVAFADTAILRSTLDRPVEVRLGLRQPGAVRLLGLLRRRHVGLLRRMVDVTERVTNGARPRPWLCVATSGHRRAWATGSGQASATAAHVQLVVERLEATKRAGGVVAAHELLPLDNATSADLRDAGIAIAIDEAPHSDRSGTPTPRA